MLSFVVMPHFSSMIFVWFSFFVIYSVSGRREAAGWQQWPKQEPGERLLQESPEQLAAVPGPLWGSHVSACPGSASAQRPALRGGDSTYLYLAASLGPGQ